MKLKGDIDCVSFLGWVPVHLCGFDASLRLRAFLRTFFHLVQSELLLQVPRLAPDRTALWVTCHFTQLPIHQRLNSEVACPRSILTMTASASTSHIKHHRPYFTPAEVERLSAKQRGKLSVSREERARQQACGFIDAVGVRSGLSVSPR